MSDCLEALCCPVCRGALRRTGGSLFCENRHSFDVAAEGYVNLMLSSRRGAGDSAGMVAARHDFLNAGVYAPVRDAMCRLAVSLAEGRAGLFADAGCGEGYYTSALYDALRAAEPGVRCAGFDVSRPAIKLAARARGRQIAYVVASSYALPLVDGAAGLLLSCFAPVCAEEFRRVLRPGGFLMLAAPGPRHLFGLKRVLYENPYENSENRFSLPGFDAVSVTHAAFEATVRDEAVGRLFLMTPYFWKTPAEGAKRLEGLDELKTEIDFELHVFQKNRE